MIEQPMPSVDPSTLTLTVDRTLADVDREAWDALVSADLPHLRTEFLAAAEFSGQGKNPFYLQVRTHRGLLGVAVAYVFPVDLLTLVPRRYTRWIDGFRSRVAPAMLHINTIIVGPIVTNCHSNMCVARGLSPDEQRIVFDRLLAGLDAIPEGRALSLFEFRSEDLEKYKSVLEAHGFVRGHSLPGTGIDVHWNSIEEYVARMRKAFRRTVVKDRRAAENLDFAIVDDFTDLAHEAWKLYRAVVARAEFVLEELTVEFFRALGPLRSTRLVTARDRDTGSLVGVELLLLGETVVQDLYTGIDYTYPREANLYFNLIYPVIGFAGAHGFKRLSLGQTSYTFKARLGAEGFPLYVYVKHRNRAVHWFLSRFRNQLFPSTPYTRFHVFRDETESPSETARMTVKDQ